MSRFTNSKKIQNVYASYHNGEGLPNLMAPSILSSSSLSVSTTQLFLQTRRLSASEMNELHGKCAAILTRGMRRA